MLIGTAGFSTRVYGTLSINGLNFLNSIQATAPSILVHLYTTLTTGAINLATILTTGSINIGTSITNGCIIIGNHCTAGATGNLEFSKFRHKCIHDLYWDHEYNDELNQNRL